MWTSPPNLSSRTRSGHLARTVLASFLLTFLGVRILVLLIMSRTLPDLYVYVGGTHIHHLNYGIFLLAGVAGFLLFVRPAGPLLNSVALAYGIGLALTFDEFGMWLHLGGSYWQRASFDAVVTIAALLALIAAAPRLRYFGPSHWGLTAVLIVAVGLFGGLLVRSCGTAGRSLAPVLQHLEESGPQ